VDGAVSGTNAKAVLAAHVADGRPAAAIIEAEAYARIADDDLLGAAVDEVIGEQPDAVADVRDGKVQAIGFLTGQVMKKTRGQADAAAVGALLRDRLGLGQS